MSPEPEIMKFRFMKIDPKAAKTVNRPKTNIIPNAISPNVSIAWNSRALGNTTFSMILTYHAGVLGPIGDAEAPATSLSPDVSQPALTFQSPT